MTPFAKADAAPKPSEGPCASLFRQPRTRRLRLSDAHTRPTHPTLAQEVCEGRDLPDGEHGHQPDEHSADRPRDELGEAAVAEGYPTFTSNTSQRDTDQQPGGSNRAHSFPAVAIVEAPADQCRHLSVSSGNSAPDRQHAGQPYAHSQRTPCRKASLIFYPAVLC